MRDLTEVVEELSARVSALEAENAALRDVAAERDARAVSRRNALRLGGLGAAVAAGSVLLRPGAAGATTGAMQFGHDNDAGTDATNLTSTSTDATLNTNNTAAGAGLQAHLTNTTSTNAAVVGLTDSTDQQSAGVVGVATDASSGAAGVLGLSASGGGVVGFTGGPAPGVWGIAGDAAGSAVVGIITDAAGSGIAVEAIQHGTGNCISGTISNSANNKRALVATTNGTGQGALITLTNANNNATAARVDTKDGGAAVEASSAKGVGGKFTGKTAQIQLMPSTAGTHPSSGARGQLFVDASGRLWYCFGGPFWKQLA